MRLTTDKTWSRQELEAALHMDEAEKKALLRWEHRHILIHAVKTAVAATFCWWLASRYGMRDGYWGAISAIIVLQSNFGSTISASRDRMLGTLIGAAFGFSFTLFGTLPWNYVLAVTSAICVCALLGFRTSARLAAVTITIIMLVHTGSQWTLALDRVLQVLLGIVVALIVTVIFPDRARLRLREGLAQEFLVLGALFEAVLQGFRGEPAEDLTKAHADALAILRSNNQLLEAARNEPSGGPGWREGLNMLSQFGRSIFDALVALELAVKDSHEDRYVQQLEPALGQLVSDIHRGFHYVASCIHTWEFLDPPPEIDLEQDIAQLESAMEAVRHTGVQYSQDDLLRAFAVQLHLKQIARLLRASRIETSQAIGEGEA